MSTGNIGRNTNRSGTQAEVDDCRLHRNFRSHESDPEARASVAASFKATGLSDREAQQRGKNARIVHCTSCDLYYKN